MSFAETPPTRRISERLAPCRYFPLRSRCGGTPPRALDQVEGLTIGLMRYEYRSAVTERAGYEKLWPPNKSYRLYSPLSLTSLPTNAWRSVSPASLRRSV